MANDGAENVKDVLDEDAIIGDHQSALLSASFSVGEASILGAKTETNLGKNFAEINQVRTHGHNKYNDKNDGDADRDEPSSDATAAAVPNSKSSPSCVNATSLFIDDRVTPSTTASVSKSAAGEIKSSVAAAAIEVNEAVPAKDFVEALYEYSAKCDNELSFKKGDLIEVLARGTDDDGWWRGRHVVTNKTGLLPENFDKPADGTAAAAAVADASSAPSATVENGSGPEPPTTDGVVEHGKSPITNLSAVFSKDGSNSIANDAVAPRGASELSTTSQPHEHIQTTAAAAAPSDAGAAAAAVPPVKRIEMVPASSIPSLRGNVPPDLKVLAQIEQQSDGSESIIPLGVFDGCLLLQVEEALRKFAGANHSPAVTTTAAPLDASAPTAAGSGPVASAEVTTSAAPTKPSPTLAVPDHITRALVISGVPAVPVDPPKAVSSFFMPSSGGYIMSPPVERRIADEYQTASGNVPNDKLLGNIDGGTAVVSSKLADDDDNKPATKTSNTTATAPNLAVAAGGSSDKPIAGRKILTKTRARPKPSIQKKSLPVAAGDTDEFEWNAEIATSPKVAKPTPKPVPRVSLTKNAKASLSSVNVSSSVHLPAKPVQIKLVSAAKSEASSNLKPSSPASHILFKFTLPKDVTERLRELQRVSQRPAASKAEREAAKNEMDRILDKHRHSAATVYDDESKETDNAKSPAENSSSVLEAKAPAVIKKPASRQSAARRKPVSTNNNQQLITAAVKFANLDAAALFESSLVDVKPVVMPAAKLAATVKKPAGVSKAVSKTAAIPPVRQDIATKNSSGAIVASGSTSSSAPVRARPRSRASAQRAKTLLGAAAPSASSNSLLPVKIEPGGLAEKTLAGPIETVPERKLYTTICPKRTTRTPARSQGAALPVKSATALRRGNNASSSNLSNRSDSTPAVDDTNKSQRQQFAATSIRPFHNVFSPRSNAESSHAAFSEEVERRSNSGFPLDEDDGTNGLVIDDEQQSVAARLRSRKSSTTTTEVNNDDATQFAEKILGDDAELEKFFRELDEHLNDEYGADSGIVDDYYQHVSARVDAECQLDQWTTKLISPAPSQPYAAGVNGARHIIDKNDIFGPLNGEDDDDLDNIGNYYETRLVRKRTSDEMNNNGEAENVDDADGDFLMTAGLDGKQPSSSSSAMTKKQKQRRLARERSKSNYNVEKFIDREITRLERHLADIPTWEDCGEPPEEVLLRFHLLQEGNCVRWGRVRGHVLPLPFKLPFDIAESELRRQDGIFDTISHDLITRKQRLIEAGRTMLLNDQLKKHFYGPLEEHCILLRGLVETDEREAQNIRHQQYNMQTAMYEAYGPYVASYTTDWQTAAVASLAGVGPAARPEDIKHYSDWFEAQDLQLREAAVAAAMSATAASIPAIQPSTTTTVATLTTTTYSSDMPAHSHTNIMSSPQSATLNNTPQAVLSKTPPAPFNTTPTVMEPLFDSRSIFPSSLLAVVGEPTVAVGQQPPPAAVTAAHEQFPFVQQQLLDNSIVNVKKTKTPQVLVQQDSVEDDLPSTPPPPILERMAETPSSLTSSPMKSLPIVAAVAESHDALESAAMSSFYSRLVSENESARRNTVSSASSGTTREPREQLSSANSRGQIYDAASIFDAADARRSRSASGSRSSSLRRRSSLMMGSSQTDYADDKRKRDADDDIDDESDDVSLPELEVQQQEQQQHVKRQSPHKRLRRDAAAASGNQGGRRREASSHSESLDDDENEMRSRSSTSASSEAPPPQLSQLRNPTPPPTRFKLTLKRAPLASDASISSRTRNRRGVAGAAAGSGKHTDDPAAVTKAGDWCVAVVAAAAATSSTTSQRTTKAKPSLSTGSSGSSVVKSDKSERRKRRRRRLENREQAKMQRRNDSLMDIQQPQKRYGTRLATKTIANDAKLQRKDRHRRGRRRRRHRQNDSVSSALTDTSEVGEDRSRKLPEDDGEDDKKPQLLSSSTEAEDDAAATPPPLLEPMLGGGEETPLVRTKSSRHVPPPTVVKNVQHVAQQTRTSMDVTGPSWLDSVFGDNSGRLSSSSRHHPQTHRQPSGDDLFRSANNAASTTAAAGGASSRLDPNDDDDAVFDALLDEQFDLSTILSENEMHNLLITSNSSMTPTFGTSSSIIATPHHHHNHLQHQHHIHHEQHHSNMHSTTDLSVSSSSHHQSVMISQGNVFTQATPHFVPVNSQQSNIPNQHHSQIFTYAAQEPSLGRNTVMVSQPMLHATHTTSGSNAHGGMVSSFASTTNIGSGSSIVMPPMLTTSFIQPTLGVPVVASVTVAPPPPLSTTNLEAIFLSQVP